MNNLQLCLVFVIGCLAGSFLGYLKGITKFHKAFDKARDVVKEKESDSIRAVYEKSGWLDCLSFLLELYR